MVITHGNITARGIIWKREISVFTFVSITSNTNPSKRKQPPVLKDILPGEIVLISPWLYLNKNSSIPKFQLSKYSKSEIRLKIMTMITNILALVLLRSDLAGTFWSNRAIPKRMKHIEVLTFIA